MFDEAKFNNYFKNHHCSDLERLKNDLLDLSQEEIEGYSKENTYAVRRYFGIIDNPVPVSNLKIYSINGKLITVKQQHSYFNQLNRYALKERRFSEGIIKSEENLKVTNEMINLVNDCTKTKLYKLYGLGAGKLIRIASESGITPKSEIDILKFEKDFNEKLTDNSKNRVLRKIVGHVLENKILSAYEKIIAKDYLAFKESKDAYKEFLLNIFSGEEISYNSYLNFINDFRDEYSSETIENSIESYEISKSNIRECELRRILER